MVLVLQNLVVSKQETKICVLLLHLKNKTIGSIFLGLHLIEVNNLLFFPLLLTEGSFADISTLVLMLCKQVCILWFT